LTNHKSKTTTKKYQKKIRKLSGCSDILYKILATYGRIKRKRRKMYDFNFSAKKVTSLRPIYFYFVALHISNLL